MTNPGNEFPAGEDFVVRWLAKLQQQINENASSIPRSFESVVAALPVSKTFYSVAQNFGLAAAKNIQISVPVPAGKTQVSVVCIGNVSVVDTTSGGVAVASSAIEVNGNSFVWSSPVMGASKDAGASVVVNNITPALGFQQAGLIAGGSFLVALSITASNPSAFPVRTQNFGSLTVVAIFS